MTDRRRFMQAAIAGAVGSALGPVVRSAAPAAVIPAIKGQRLAEDLVVYSGAGGNVVTLGTAATGLLMVDTGAAEHTSALLEAVQAQAGTQRVATAFNTHWHWDHTGGNEVLAKAGTAI